MTESVRTRSNGASEPLVVFLGHRIALAPTPEQETLFWKAAGTARFAYNWALAEWQRQYDAGERPSKMSVDRAFNAVKHAEFPWVREVPARVTQIAIWNLGDAFVRFFDPKLKARYPQFKSRRKARPSFCPAYGPETFRMDGKRIRLPKVGWVKMREALRFEGQPLSVTVSHDGRRWYVSIPVRVEWTPPARESQAVGGVDIGVRRLATTSDGTVHENPRVLQRQLKRLRRLNRRMARREGPRPGVAPSANWHKAKADVARLHRKIRDARADTQHKVSRAVVAKYTVLGVPAHDVVGMIREGYQDEGMAYPVSLARPLSDAAMGETLRQLWYKGTLYGTHIVEAAEDFPSSRLCSACGVRNDRLTLSARRWMCHSCGVIHDRDVNAALNLRNVALNEIGRVAPEFTPVETAALASVDSSAEVKLRSSKQEPCTGGEASGA